MDAVTKGLFEFQKAGWAIVEPIPGVQIPGRKKPVMVFKVNGIMLVIPEKRVYTITDDKGRPGKNVFFKAPFTSANIYKQLDAFFAPRRGKPEDNPLKHLMDRERSGHHVVM